jgi:hypothetical protein
MNLTIDNLQGAGPVNYTSALDGTVAPRVQRKIYQPVTLRFSLLATATTFVTPVIGARVVLAKTNGNLIFTGYLTQAPELE